MIKFEELRLKETEEHETYYVGTLDTHIIVTKDRSDLAGFSVGKINVHHDGIYFGAPDEMDEWVRSKIIDHLIEKGSLVEVGETSFGDKLWRLKG